MSEEKPEDIAPEGHQEFVLWFMKKNNGIINRYISRRMIPNRYHQDDIKSYMIERMLDILQKREEKDKAIEEPKVYFRKLLDFWCIEYQRMHGFCYGLPKRPRKPEDEQEISKYGFVYLNMVDSDGESSTYPSEIVSELGYIDSNITYDCDDEEEEFRVINRDPDVKSESWDRMMSMALPEDRLVLENMFRYNLTVPQISKKLNIAVSTAYQRKERGMKAISGTLASFVDLDNFSWKILDDTANLDQDEVNIEQFFKKK